MSRPRKLPCSIADERSELVQAALTYHRLGLCVIPVRTGTKVAQSWKRYQAERPSEATIRRWFASGSSNSVPFVMGPVSGGLICRDFDDLTAYERWAAQFPQLAQTLPTVETGGGGRHVYAKADSSQIGEFDRAYLKFDDGELRLRSCYCVAAPSSHPDGGTYRWIIPLGSDIPAIDIRSAGFTQQYTAGATESNREHRDN